MFDWFIKFIYGLTSAILSMIDGLLECANKLCGIETIKVDGKETDLMTFVLFSDEVSLAFRIVSILAFILVLFFAIFAICKSCVSEKSQETPAKIVGKAAKTILMFMFVPFCMFAFTWIVNEFMKAIYSATLNGASSIGHFLFSTFSEGAYRNGWSAADVIKEEFDYSDVDQVWAAVDLWDFQHGLAWFAGIAILISLGIAMISFVERAISIAVLYIAAPFTLATSVVDDGAKFKLWREQVLVKYLSGYGMIIGINIYALIIGILVKDNVEIFESGFFDNIFKIVIILGGAFSLTRIGAIVGNLVSQGAGDREAQAAAATARSVGSGMLTPLRAGRAGANFVMDWKKRGLATTAAQRLGLRNKTDYRFDKDEKKDDNKNDNVSMFRASADTANAIGGNNDNNNDNKSNENNNNDNNNSNNNNSNQNNNSPNEAKKGTGQNMISNAIAGGGDKK